MTERLGKLASALLVASLALPRVSLAAAPEAAPVVAEASDEPSDASVRAALAEESGRPRSIRRSSTLLIAKFTFSVVAASFKKKRSARSLATITPTTRPW